MNEFVLEVGTTDGYTFSPYPETQLVQTSKTLPDSFMDTFKQIHLGDNEYKLIRKETEEKTSLLFFQNFKMDSIRQFSQN